MLGPFERVARGAALGAALLLAWPAAAQEVTVFAAASLKNALDAVATAWTAAGGGRATLSYAASSALAKQIEAGAPADVFVSADRDWMDYLADRDLVRKDSIVELLGNRIVLVAPVDSTATATIAPGFDLSALLGDGRLAMANVDAVPAGKYGKASLEALGVWDTVAGRVAQAENVRAALALVATGEAPLGIVYATDAAAEFEGPDPRRLPGRHASADRLSCRRDDRGDGAGHRGVPRLPALAESGGNSSRRRASRCWRRS